MSPLALVLYLWLLASEIARLFLFPLHLNVKPPGAEVVDIAAFRASRQRMRVRPL